MLEINPSVEASNSTRRSMMPDERDPLLENSKPLSVSKAQKRTGRLQFFALCISIFVVGWNDGSLGPLLPRIMQYYEVNYGTVSWIFVVSCMGVIFGALAAMPLNDKLGYGKTVALGSMIQSFAFLSQSLGHTLAFPAFAASFFLCGVGLAIQDAQANTYTAVLKQSGELKMGLLQAAYGLGTLLSPVCATRFSQASNTIPWSFHYLVSFAFSIVNIVTLVRVFRNKTQDECLSDAGESVPVKRNGVTCTENGNSKYAQIFRLKAVHLLALFLVLYNGVLFTMGGWIVTFIIVARGGGLESGYIAAGFFAGFTMARIVWIPLNKKLGEVRAVYLYITFMFIFQLVFTFNSSSELNGLLVCIIGLLLGPLYPIAIRHAARVIPRSLVTGAIGWIAACGAAGSALLPFLTGRMALRWGIEILMPCLLVVMACMGAVWIAVPTQSAEDPET